MNWVDLVLIIVFLLAIWAGLSRGFIRGSLDLAGWAGSFVLAYVFYGYAAKALAKIADLNVWLLPVSFLLTLVVARLLIGFITSFIIRSLPEHSNHNWLNRFLGIVPGAINGWIVSIIISALLLALPLRDTINNETRESKWATTLAMQSEWANKKLAPVFDEAVRHTMNSLMVDPRSNKKVPLGFTYDKAEIRPYLEIKMLELVNKERAKEGLPALKADPAMTRVARAHSRDMFVRGYFAHNSPDGKTPFDRMRAAGVQFSAAGENLALAQTLEIAHTNLMNSPGHRANILHPAFGRLGIGILDGGFFGLMVSQEFRN
ncbi:MAG TPA: CvpA family protein [Chitinophagaceae bacterium]|nr:CvpA family protein [Chitinophagaceae bacterium]